MLGAAKMADIRTWEKTQGHETDAAEQNNDSQETYKEEEHLKSRDACQDTCSQDAQSSA